MPVQFDRNTQSDLLKKIRQSVEQNSTELQLAFSERPLNTVAWLARNLLELAIWSEYCTQSEENAKEFVIDSARDACDVLDIPDGLLSKESFQPIRQELIAKARTDGFDIEENYTRVATAAKKLGRIEFFKHMNKAFSKFAHPTALSIVYNPNDEETLLRQKFHDIGMDLSQIAVQFLNTKLIEDRVI